MQARFMECQISTINVERLFSLLSVINCTPLCPSCFCECDGSSDSSLHSSFLHKLTIKDSLTSLLLFACLRLNACHSSIGGNLHAIFRKSNFLAILA